MMKSKIILPPNPTLLSRSVLPFEDCQSAGIVPPLPFPFVVGTMDEDGHLVDRLGALRHMNLILAIMWLILGVLFLALPWLAPVDADGRSLSAKLGSTQLYAAIAFLLVLFNIARWWSSTSRRRHRQAIREDLARQSSRGQESGPSPERAVDPRFDFSDRPPT
jgi:hypothetical protein